jgi:Fe2+ or Zn2+ uptake regulation protein
MEAERGGGAAVDRAAGRVDAIVERLRDSGGRVTVARRALVEAMVGADGHVTADDLAETIQARHPEVHRSTVYRSLDALEQAGVVEHVHLGHGRAVYHLADERHLHLVCERCGVVVEVPATSVDRLRAELRTSTGFVIAPHHFGVPGWCAACAAADRPRRDADSVPQ